MPPKKEAIPRHDKCDEVEAVLAELRAADWMAFKNAHGHWARLACPHPCECMFSVAGTPKSCANEAKRVRRRAKRCQGP